MAIIKHTTKDGNTYCYESTPKWDPVLKQARPQKTYLGRWDEATQSIIPSTGKRGRKKKEETSAGTQTQGETGVEAQLREAHEKILQLQKDLQECRAQIASLSEQNRKYAAAIAFIRSTIEQM